MKASARSKQRKKVQLLSTNNKSFTNGGRMIGSVRQDMVIHSGIADEDVRLERVRNSHHAARQASRYATRNERVSGAILEESRNGYHITAKAPREHDAAVKHYTEMLRRYTLDFPEEWALCHFSLGKIFASDSRPSEDRSRNIENAIFHFKTASQVFTASSFPAMWAVSALMQANLYRERAQLMGAREFTMPNRGTATTSSKLGVEIAEEAVNFFTVEPHRFLMEQGFARMQMGWLLLLLSEYDSDNITTFELSQLLERAISHLEKAVSIFQRLVGSVGSPENAKLLNAERRKNQSGISTGSTKPKLRWSNIPEERGQDDGDVSKTAVDGTDLGLPYHPFHHLRVLLAKKPIVLYSGLTTYLLGNAYYGLCTEGDVATCRDTLYMSYEYLSDALKLKYSLKESVQWVEARILLASLVMKDPSVLDESSPTVPVSMGNATTQIPTSAPSSLKPLQAGPNKLAPANAPLPTPPDNNLAIEVALSHLNLALTSPLCKKRLTEIYFMIAKAHFAKLHFLSDTVVSPASFATPLSDGTLPAEVMSEAEENFQKAVKRVSAVSKSGIDAYIYFFSSLKIAELRVLQAVAINYQEKENKDGSKSLSRTKSISHVNDIATKSDRDYLFQSALKYLLDALQAKKPFENVDLHFLSSSQMGYLLSIGPKRELSVHCFVRTMMCLSCIIIRSRFFEIPNVAETVVESNNLGHKKKKRHGTSEFYSARTRTHRSLHQMADEAKRISSMALLASLKLVTWLKPSRMGEFQRSGFGLWSFEKRAALSTRYEALTGKRYGPPRGTNIDRVSSRVSMTSLGDNCVSGGSVVSDTSIRRTPTKPLDPPPLQGTTYNRLDDESVAPYQNAEPKNTLPQPSKTAKRIVAVEVEVEESKVLKSTTSFIRPRTPGRFINADDVPVAPSHIKAPPKEYKDVTVTRKVKKIVHKEVDDDSVSIKHVPSITSLNLTDGGLKNRKHDPVEDNALPSYRKRTTFMDRLNNLFSKKHRKKMKRKILKMATEGAANAINAPTAISTKLKEAVATTEVTKVASIEVIGTEHCVFGLALLSHLYRQLLMLKCLAMEVGKGARVRQLLSSYLVEEHSIETLKDAHAMLRKHCEHIVPCPWTLQELSESCTHKELRMIFKSQLKISNALLTEEVTFNRSMVKIDPFLPLVLTLPSYHRLAAEDSTDNEFNLDEERILVANNVVKDPVAELVQAEPRARRQAKFGKKRSQTSEPKPVTPVVSNAAFTPLGVPPGGNIGMNAEENREGRRQWAAYLDSTAKGMENFFAKHLKSNEAMIHWHMFTSALTALGSNSYPLQSIIAWKDTVEDIAPYAAAGVSGLSAEVLAQKAKTAASKYDARRADPDREGKADKDDDLFKLVKIEKLFMEYGRSDVDLSQINYALQSFVDAIHSRPAPIRASKSTAALSLLSDCFAMSELLCKLPAHVDTIVICCPSFLSIVPWSLLFIEDLPAPAHGADVFGRNPERAYDVGVLPEEQTVPNVIHVMDKYSVRLGTTIPIMELTSLHASQLSHAPGQHKLCCVDTDDQATLPLTEAETGSIMSLWSGDHWDYNLLQGIWASASALSTKFLEKNKKKGRESTGSRPGTAMDRPGTAMGRPGTAMGRPGTAMGRPGTAMGRPGTAIGRPGSRSEGKADGGDEIEDEKSEEDMDQEIERRHRTSQSLIGCRVLHMCALWEVSPLPPPTAAEIAANPRAIKPWPAIALPDGPTNIGGSTSGPRIDNQTRFDARTIVSQLYLKNCALVVLSRMGILDNIQAKHLSLSAAEGGILKDTAWDVIDAFHLSGASTVLFPLWGGGSMGGDLGQLARLLLYLRFYFELPNYAHVGRPVAKALQMTQIWLRGATIADIKEFLDLAPIPEKSCDELKIELVSFEKAKSKGAQRGDSPGPDEIKLFSHFFYWGMLTVSGDCSNVHPAGVGGDIEEENVKKRPKTADSRTRQNIVQGSHSNGMSSAAQEQESNKQEGEEDGDSDSDSNEDETDEMHELIREMQWLRMEGSHKEADLIEKEIWRRRQVEIDRVKSKLNEATGEVARRTSVALTSGQNMARRTSVALAKGSSILTKSAETYGKKISAAAAHAKAGKQGRNRKVYHDGGDNLPEYNYIDEAYMSEDQKPDFDEKPTENEVEEHPRGSTEDSSAVCALM